jgi:membrane-associated phospholipid phosphatase
MKLLEMIQPIIQRFRHADRRVISGVGSLVGCFLLLLSLGWLCQEVLEKETFRWDTAVLLGLHQWANPVLDTIMLSITRLGDPEFVVVIVAVSFGWLLWQQQRLKAGILIIVCCGTLLLNQGMKLAFARPRPLLWQRLIEETSYGFPSGHALGSLVLYGFMAYVLADRYPQYSRSIYSISVGLIALIGFSRLYLGVHYPTDILAGYAVGFLWLITCTFMLKISSTRLMRINRVDRP